MAQDVPSGAVGFSLLSFSLKAGFTPILRIAELTLDRPKALASHSSNPISTGDSSSSAKLLSPLFNISAVLKSSPSFPWVSFRSPLPPDVFARKSSEEKMSGPGAPKTSESVLQRANLLAACPAVV